MLVSACTSIKFGVEVQTGLFYSPSFMILKQNVRRKKTSLDDDETRPRHSRNNPKTNKNCGAGPTNTNAAIPVWTKWNQIIISHAQLSLPIQ